MLLRHAKLSENKGLKIMKKLGLDWKLILKDTVILYLVFIAGAVPLIAVFVGLELLFENSILLASYTEPLVYVLSLLLLVYGFYKISKNDTGKRLIHMSAVAMLASTPTILSFVFYAEVALLMNCVVIFSAMLAAYGLKKALLKK